MGMGGARALLRDLRLFLSTLASFCVAFSRLFRRLSPTLHSGLMERESKVCLAPSSYQLDEVASDED